MEKKQTVTDAPAQGSALAVELIHENALADLSGMTPSRIRHLSDAGHLPPVDASQYPLLETFRALFLYLQRDENNTTKQRTAELLAARCKLTSNKADLAEIDLARARGDTFSAGTVAGLFADVITATRQRLLAAPSKYAGQFVGIETVTESHKRWKAAIVAITTGLARPLVATAPTPSKPAKSKARGPK